VLLLATNLAPSAAQPSASPLALDPLPVRAWLEARDFDALEERFAAARRAPDAYELSLLVGAFSDLTPEQDTGLDAWAAERPASAPARLALARRELGRAWAARGTGFATSVDAQGASGMRAHAQRAARLAESVVDQDPHWLDARRIQIECAQLLGDRELASRSFSAALAVDPTHFDVWWNYQASFRRRWGGSYEAVEEIGRAAQEHAAANPRLRPLLGAADRERADDHFRAGRLAEALAALDRAAAHGETPHLLLERSRVRAAIGDASGARSDLERALALDPYLAKLHDHRGALCEEDRDFACEADAAARAVALAPSDPDYLYRLNWARWAVQNPGAATRQIERNPLQSWLYRHAKWIYLHALESAVIATLVGIGAYLARARHRRRREADASEAYITRAPLAPTPIARQRPSMVERLPRTGLQMVRAFVWLTVVYHVLAYSESFGPRADLEVLVPDLAITALALAGALGFAYGLRLGAAWLWKVWAFAFPIWNTLYPVYLMGYSWDQWPAWCMVHTILLPVYAVLFCYGFGCAALWEGGLPGPAWVSRRRAQAAADNQSSRTQAVMATKTTPSRSGARSAT